MLKRYLAPLGLLLMLLWAAGAEAQTPTPSETPARLDNKTSYGAFRRFQFTIDPGACAATTTCWERIRLDGIQPGDLVKVQRPAALSDDIAGFDCASYENNFLACSFYNMDPNEVDPNEVAVDGVWWNRTDTRANLADAVYTFKPTPTATP